MFINVPWEYLLLGTCGIGLLMTLAVMACCFRSLMHIRKTTEDPACDRDWMDHIVARLLTIERKLKIKTPPYTRKN